LFVLDTKIDFGWSFALLVFLSETDDLFICGKKKKQWGLQILRFPGCEGICGLGEKRRRKQSRIIGCMISCGEEAV